MRLQTVAGYPVEQHNSPNRGFNKDGSDRRMDEHRGVVLHIAEGGYRGTIDWQMNPDQKLSDGTPYNTCSTWVVGKAEGQIAQMVDSDVVAWCQRAGSLTWLSIEHAGFTTDADVPTAWQRKVDAELFRWSAQRYGHPLAIANTDADRGLGHHSMDREWAGVEWGHEQCPGQYVIAAKPEILRIAQGIINGEDEDMTPQELLTADVLPGVAGNQYTVGGAIYDGMNAAKAAAARASALQNTAAAILAAVQGDSTDDILARINELAAAESARDAQLADLVRQGLSGELDAETVLHRMGEVLTAGTAAG